MKKNDVQIGEVYSAKVGAKSAAVRIDGVSAFGIADGWNGTNMKTHKPVRIKSARQLRGKAATWPGRRGGVVRRRKRRAHARSQAARIGS